MAQPRPAYAGPFAMAFFVPSIWLGLTGTRLHWMKEDLTRVFFCGFVIGVHAVRMRCDEERELWWR